MSGGGRGNKFRPPPLPPAAVVPGAGPRGRPLAIDVLLSRDVARNRGIETTTTTTAATTGKASSAGCSRSSALPVGGAVFRAALLEARGFAVVRVSAAEWRALGKGGSGSSDSGFGRGTGARSSSSRSGSGRSDSRGGGRGRSSSSSSESSSSSFWDDDDDDDGSGSDGGGFGGEGDSYGDDIGVGYYYSPAAARTAAEDAFVARLMARAAGQQG